MGIASRIVSEIFRERKLLVDEYQTRHAFTIQRHFRYWRRWKNGWRLFRHGMVRIQSRFRSWAPKREVALLRAHVGPQTSRLPSQLMALMPDRRGRLTRYRPFRSRERSAAHSTRLVRLKVLPRHLLWDLEDAILPLQSFVRGWFFRRAVRRIQRVARGWLTRRRLERKHQEAIRVQALVRGNSARSIAAERRSALNEIADVENEEPTISQASVECEEPRETSVSTVTEDATPSDFQQEAAAAPKSKAKSRLSWTPMTNTIGRD